MDLHEIPKLCFEGERSWKRGLGSPVEFQLCAFSGRPTRLATIRKDTGEMQILLSCGRHG